MMRSEIRTTGATDRISMTVEALIYARGGGRGHAMRGRSLALLLEQLGIRSAVITRGDGQTLDSARDGERARYLFVDTFPLGWRDELSPDFVRSFPRRVLVSRAMRTAHSSDSLALFDTVLDPYPAEFSEWREVPRGSHAIGYLLRPELRTVRASGEELLIVDPERRASEGFLATCARLAKQSELQLRVTFELPGAISAKKLLVIGAGYNTFYELLSSTADIRFLPVRKRHDDQQRRCALFGKGIASLHELREWLHTPPPARPLPRPVIRTTLAHLAPFLLALLLLVPPLVVSSL